MIPYLYNLAVATQPVFVISESSEDTLSYRGRGITRDSSTKAIIAKICIISSDVQWYGWGMFSATADGLKTKNPTESASNPTGPYAFRTPKGNIVYMMRLSGMFSDNGAYNVVATINGTRCDITDTSFVTTNDKQEFDIQLFLLTMCDFYLF